MNDATAWQGLLMKNCELQKQAIIETNRRVSSDQTIRNLQAMVVSQKAQIEALRAEVDRLHRLERADKETQQIRAWVAGMDEFIS